MDGILPRKVYGIKGRFLRNMRRCRDGRLRVRYLVICNLLHGRSASLTAAAVPSKHQLDRLAVEPGPIKHVLLGLLDHTILPTGVR